jgi:predicted  nucleic acid-binding Zn-ribbon protein
MATKKPTAAARSRKLLMEETADILDRVTRAEERVVAMDRRHEEWHTEARLSRNEIDARLAAIENSLQRYQGAWGTLTIIVSAVAVAVGLFKEAIFKRMGWG